MNKRPLIYDFHEHPLTGNQIEALSFATIDREAPTHNHLPREWEIVRRMIHTTADMSLIHQVCISSNAVEVGIKALKEGAPLFADSNMIRSGLSMSRLKSVCANYTENTISCYVADADVARQASQEGMPRSLYGLRKAEPMLNGAIAIFGNAPVALLELNRMIIEEHVKPALVIAMPVGFVHVIESKEELMSLNVPYIAISGRRGGSPLAVSVVHALCNLAMDEFEKETINDAGKELS